MRKTEFKRVARTWDEYWAEFWRIRLVGGDDAAEFKSEQVVDFCWKVLGIKKGQKVLDLACGAGFQAVLLAERGANVHGVDITPVLIKHAKKLAKQRGVAATFEVQDMRTLTVHEKFDHVVVLGMSFGFGTDEENVQSLHRMFDALESGGKLLLTGQHPYSLTNHLGPEWLECDEGILLHRADFDPERCRLGGSWELACPDGTIIMEGENPEQDGIRCYTMPEIKSLLEMVGFEDVQAYGAWYTPPQPLQWFSMEMIVTAYKPK
ncbi:methyltransferase domain-containing protein [bacterium]|nr:methyltransferase domain-containing protein [bacterium]